MEGGSGPESKPAPDALASATAHKMKSLVELLTELLTELWIELKRVRMQCPSKNQLITIDCLQLLGARDGLPALGVTISAQALTATVQISPLHGDFIHF
ncbi:MAG: hypothetical protein WBZ01_00175 [Terriglobales bacterium]|jgi:hypothetical protein